MKHRVILGCLTAVLSVAASGAFADDQGSVYTATPIKHLVVIFQENVSFDHYFGTYPVAQNNPGETPFKASPHTPTSINTLVTPLDVNNQFVPLTGLDLINMNPNGPLGSGAAINGANPSLPEGNVSGCGAVQQFLGRTDSPLRAAAVRPRDSGGDWGYGSPGVPPPRSALAPRRGKGARATPFSADAGSIAMTRMIPESVIYQWPRRMKSAVIFRTLANAL